MTPGQPTLPAEVAFTDAERLFIQEQPQRLWPENQNSNIGQIRRVLTDELQDAINQVNSLFNEGFVDTALERLGSWEIEYGIPIGTSKATADRRAEIKSRIQKQMFTRTRRKSIVEQYIQATQGGSPIQLVPDGVALGSGIDIWGEPGVVTSLYTITENITGFSYAVSISGTVTPDIGGLTRALGFITPSHISFTVTNP